MRALVFGAPPDPDEVRPEAHSELERKLAALPFGLHEVADATPLRPDWVVTRPILSGICGSDAKLVLGDFGEGDVDNPMSAFSSLPHVPGHEVVAEVEEACVAHDVPVATAYSAREIALDPHFAARGDLVSVGDPVLGPLRQQAPYPRLVGERVPVPTGAPVLGAHNRRVWCEMVGLGPDELEELEAKGIV